MHPEAYEISPRLAALVERVREDGGRIWAVGTTVVRALESAARDDGTINVGRSETLLMLVSAFAGHELTVGAYRHAVSHRYRFYSYGDAMVIL